MGGMHRCMGGMYQYSIPAVPFLTFLRVVIAIFSPAYPLLNSMDNYVLLWIYIVQIRKGVWCWGFEYASTALPLGFPQW